MANFESKFGLSDFVEFLEKKTHKKPKRGWIHEVSFSEGLILYLIQGEDNKRGQCYYYERIEESLIIGETECD